MTHNQQPVIAITGGSMGLGYALAGRLLKEGFAVAICARRQKALDAAVETLSKHGSIVGFVGDISDPFFRATFLQNVREHFDRLDGLVNNASSLGDLPMPRLSHTTAPNLRKVFEVNAFAPVLLTQEAIPFLLQQPHAIVLNISSDAAVGGYPSWGVYGASKSALDLFTKTFAGELSDTNIRFFSVDPSDMQTEMHEMASPGDEGLANPDDVAAALVPLFLPLVAAETDSFPSGSRLAVSGVSLVVTEGL